MKGAGIILSALQTTVTPRLKLKIQEVMVARNGRLWWDDHCQYIMDNYQDVRGLKLDEIDLENPLKYFDETALFFLLSPYKKTDSGIVDIDGIMPIFSDYFQLDDMMKRNLLNIRKIRNEIAHNVVTDDEDYGQEARMFLKQMIYGMESIDKSIKEAIAPYFKQLEAELGNQSGVRGFNFTWYKTPIGKPIDIIPWESMVADKLIFPSQLHIENIQEDILSEQSENVEESTQELEFNSEELMNQAKAALEVGAKKVKKFIENDDTVNEVINIFKGFFKGK